MGKIIGAVIAAVVVYFGMYSVARYRIADRFSTYASEVRGSCKGRGNDELTAEQVGARVQAAAERAGVELLDLRVTVEPLTRANAARAGAVMEAAIQQAHTITHGAHFAGMPGPPPTKETFGTLATMTASIRAKRWLWSEERDVENTCVQQ